MACGVDGNGGRAAALNAHFDEWQDLRRGLPVTGERAPVHGTIRWLFQEYRRSKAYLEKVSIRSRPDYERTMQIVESVETKERRHSRRPQDQIRYARSARTGFTRSSWLALRVAPACPGRNNDHAKLRKRLH